MSPKRSPITAWLRRAFTENLPLKIVALVGAIVLFSLVRGAEDAQRSVFVDVVAILPPADSGKILVSEVPDRVKVTLQGSRSLLNSIRREDLEPVQVDLSRDTGLRYYYMDPTSFDLPAGIQIVQMAPASIPLTWAERIDRRVRVEAQIMGEPGEGLEVREPVGVEPRRVLLRGPQNEVDPLAAIETQPIDVSGLDAGEHVRRVRLERPPPHSSYVGEPIVEVRFEVARQLAERSLESLEVSTVGPHRAEVRPEVVTVELEGPESMLAELTPTEVVPWVDVSDPELEGTVPRPVQVRGLPEMVTVGEVRPAEVLVTIREAP